MNKRLIVAIIALLMPLTVLRAQRFITIFDLEVNQPVRGVSVGIDYNKADTTNVYGQVFIPAKFDTLFIKKSGYVALRIPCKYVEDSIPLIRDYHHIGEVVVYAERSKELDQAVHRWVKEDKTEVEAAPPYHRHQFQHERSVQPTSTARPEACQEDESHLQTAG